MYNSDIIHLKYVFLKKIERLSHDNGEALFIPRALTTHTHCEVSFKLNHDGFYNRKRRNTRRVYAFGFYDTNKIKRNQSTREWTGVLCVARLGGSN